MKEMKKVSVIIPTYKRPTNLERALNSVLKQTYNNIEIIVVDDNNDGSEYREETEKLMDKYIKNPNIIYLKHHKNKNGAAARNTGIKKASGEYITFLDDDDYFLSSRIEKLVKLLEDNKEYKMAYTGVLKLRNEKIISYTSANKKGKFILELLENKSFFGTGSNMFFKKELIEKIGEFDERFTRNQDLEYMIRAFEYSDILNVNEILVIKFTDDVSNIPKYEKLKQIKKLFLTKFDNVIKTFSKEEQNNIYYFNMLEIVYTTFDNKTNYELAMKDLLKYHRNDLKTKIRIFYKKYNSTFRILDFLRGKNAEINIKKEYSKEECAELNSYISQVKRNG